MIATSLLQIRCEGFEISRSSVDQKIELHRMRIVHWYLGFYPFFCQFYSAYTRHGC